MALAKASFAMATPSMLSMLRPRVLQARPLRFINAQRRLLNMQPTRRVMMSQEEHRAHTISERLRQMKKIPVELLPLGFVLLVAVVAAVYSLARKTWTDKTLRLWRSGKHGDD